MSERYIVGDKIDLSTLPNQTYVFPNGVKPVGLRIYGDTKTAVTNSGLTFDVNETTGGAVVSTDIDISSVALDGYKDISTSELDEYFGTGYAAPRLHPRTGSTLYAPIFAVLTEDTAVYISEHIAKITIDGEQAVRFSRQHPYYGIYGEGIKASFDADFEDTDQGVYDTSATNTTIMSNYDQKDVIYIKGSGTIWVWAGNAPAEFPFKAQGKGGGSGGDGSTKYIGTTTTALSNGSTTNPITVDGESYTAQFGDIAVYNYTEFIFDGTKWGEFGRDFDTTPTNGSANAVTSNGIYELIHKGSQNYSTAMGDSTIASGIRSTAMGSGTTASGVGSTAMGAHTYASGNNSTAMGDSTIASGDNSTAMGRGTTANQNYSTAMGMSTIASGVASTAMGQYANASGAGSVAMNYNTKATQNYMTAMGKYNSPRTGDLFNIGNGTADNARSNIVEVNGTSMNVNGDIKRNGISLGDLAYKNSASGTLTGTAVNVSVTGTPEGNVSVTPTTDSVASVTNKGTLPSFSYNSTTEELTFNAGTLPTTTNKTVMTGASASFTGTSITSTGTVTAEGSVTVS